jgi:hypothetical protein
MLDPLQIAEQALQNIAQQIPGASTLPTKTTG